MYITTFADSYVQINYSLSLSLSLLDRIRALEKNTRTPRVHLVKSILTIIFYGVTRITNTFSIIF